MTKTKTLLRDPAGKITLHLCQAAHWPSFHALVKCELRAMAVEVADDAHELSWTVETEEPLHHRRAPARMGFTGRRSTWSFDREDCASATGVEPDDPRISVVHDRQDGQMPERSHRRTPPDLASDSGYLHCAASESHVCSVSLTIEHRGGQYPAGKAIEAPGPNPDTVSRRRRQRESEHHHCNRKAEARAHRERPKAQAGKCDRRRCTHEDERAQRHQDRPKRYAHLGIDRQWYPHTAHAMPASSAGMPPRSIDSGSTAGPLPSHSERNSLAKAA